MAGIHFDITGDNSNFLRRLREVENGVKNTSKQIEQSGLGIEELFNRMTRAAAAFGAGFTAKELISNIAQVRGEFQQLEVAFKTMLGSEDKANALMQQLVKTAAITPFDLQGVANGAKQLLAYGENVENVNDNLIRLGNIAAGLSQPLGDIVYLYGTTMTQGRLYTADLNQFTGRGIPMIRELAKVFGVAEGEVKSLVEAGKVGFPEVQKVIQNLTNEGGMFYNLMQEQSKTITGQISNIEDAVSTMFNEIGKANEGIINEALSGVSYLVENYEKVGKILISLVATYGVYKVAVMTVTALQALQASGIAVLTIAERAHYGWLVLQTTAQKALNAVMLTNPYVLLSAAVVGLGVAMWSLSDNTTSAERALDSYNKKIEKLNTDEEDRKRILEGLVSTINSEVEADVTKLKALKDIEELYPALFRKYVDEKGHIQDLIGFWKAYNEEVVKSRTQSKQAIVESLEQQIKSAEWAYNLAKKENNRSEMKVQAQRIEDLKNELANARKDVLSGINAQLEIENKQGTKETTYQEDLANAKAEWEKAKKGYEALIKDKAATSKQVKESRDKMLSAEKAYKELGGATGNELAKQKSHSKKEVEDRLKQQEQLAEELLSIRRKNQQDEINLMADGTEKKLAQIDLDYQKELDAIEKQREEWNKKQKGKLTDEQETQLAESEENAYKKYENNVKDTNKEKLDADKKAWQEYFIAFGDYQEKRKAITQKYEDEIADIIKKEGSNGEIASARARRASELSSLDEQYGKSAKAMADLFEDASDKSVNAIQAVIDKYELLVSYLSGENGVTVEDLKTVGFTDKDLKSIEDGTINIKDITDSIKNLKDTLSGKSPFKKFTEGVKNGISDLKNAKGDTDAIGTGISKIGNAVVQFSGPLKEFSSNIGNIFGFDDSKIQGAIDALEGLGQTTAGVGQIMSGDIVGGAMSAVNGISSVVSALDGMFGADYSHYNTMKEQYDTLNSIWDELIDKKKEYINTSYGVEANKVGKEALELAEKSIESYRILGKERLNAGASAGSHSIGVRIRKGMSKEGWEQAREALGADFDKATSGRMTGLFDLSAEQVEKLKEADIFWSKLDDDVREYLQGIIDGEERIKDIQNQIKEQLTQVSFDSVFDSFVDMLINMDSSAEDFSKNFEQYMQRAILTTMVGNKYKDKLQAWYDSFAKANDDKAGITKEEMEKSQAEWDAIVAEALAERNALKDAMGWTGDSTPQQGGSQRGFGTEMTHEDAGELSGRFTALQISNEEIKSQMINVVVGIGSLVSISTEGNATLGNILNQHVITNGYLEDIVKYTKLILELGSKLDKIVDNTKNM